MSMAMTPGERPAPEQACMEVINTRSMPKASYRGLRAMAKPVVVQLGTGVTKPFQPLPFPLFGDEEIVVEVHARDEDRDVLLVSERRRRGNHGSGAGVEGFQGFGGIGLHRGENHIDPVASILDASCTSRDAKAGSSGSRQYQRKAPWASVMGVAVLLPADRSEAAKAVTSK